MKPNRAPAPPTRLYSGRFERSEPGPGTVLVSEASGAVRSLDPRRDLANHSPTGFAWGYAGSGPAQLALALVADATGDDALALRVYQEFKFRTVAHWGPTWAVDAALIQGTVERILEDRAEEVGG